MRTNRRLGGTTMLAALVALPALLALPGAAMADVAGDTSTTTAMPARTFLDGSFDFQGDSDWYRVELKAGRNYALGTSVPRFGTMQIKVRDAAGAVAVESAIFGGPWDGTGGSGGMEFRVPADGTYFVEAVDLGETAYPTAYRLMLDDADCPASRFVACAIGAGQTETAILAWYEDGDWLSLAARQGLTYTLRVDACEPLDLRVLGPFGAVKAVGTPDASGASLTWKAPQTKTYLVRVMGNAVTEQGTPYDLSVSQGVRRAPKAAPLSCPAPATRHR